MPMLNNSKRFRRLLLWSIILNACWACEPAVKYPAGGYSYPEAIDKRDSNFHYYPLKDVMTLKDSFNNVFGAWYHAAFDEPNLSLKGRDKEVFRLIYGDFEIKPLIIILTDGKLIVKTGNSQHTVEAYDMARLTKREQQHFELLQSWFPLDDTARRHPVQKYLDSTAGADPELLDPGYYMALIKKSIPPNKEPFTYSTKIIPLSKAAYSGFIDDINQSGYWKLPYFIKCNEAVTGGSVYSLEANTKHQYNMVWKHICPNDTSKFTKLCQKIVDYAGMSKEIDLIWE
jgi:uncharacterized CHY-type Zn-finger protein